METSNASASPPVGTAPASGLPARGYSWEPFTANNTKSLKHGARSERIIAPLAAAIANDLLAQHSRLRDNLYREAVLEYSRTLAQVDVLQEWVDEHGMIGADGKPTGAAEYLLRVRKHASNLAGQLGLTPLANAKLGKDSAAASVDIAKLMAELAKGKADT